MQEGFIIPELIVESIIRDGLLNVKADLTIVDSLFSQLLRDYNSRKYGSAEIAKIKTMIQKDIAVVYSYHEVDQKSPCFSIMIGSDAEDRKRDHMDDHYEDQKIVALSSGELAALVKVPTVTILSYDPNSGILRLDDSVDLTPVYAGMILVDVDNNEFTIQLGMDNTPGSKMITIEKNAEIDIVGNAKIKSSIVDKRFEVKGITSDINLVIGAHSKDPLMTKYLYIFLKYFIVSRKFDMSKRGIYLSMFNGSDFNRDQEFLGDKVTTRFLTVMAKVDDTWRGDLVKQVDSIEVDGEPVE